MKIAVITSSFPRYQGDFQGNFIYYLAREQVERGNTVHVICPHIPGTPFHEVMDGIDVHRFPYFYPYRFQRLFSDAGMYYALRHSLLAWIQLPVFFLCQIYAAHRVIRQQGIDLLHTHWLVPQGLTGAVLHGLTGIPHIATVHGSDVNILKNQRVLHSLCRFIARNSIVITVNSNYMKQQLLEVSPQCEGRVKMIPMGIEPKKFTSSVYPEIRSRYQAEHIIFCAGRLIELKGIGYLIDAMPGILSRLPNTRLLVAGEGPEKVNLIKKIQMLNLGSHVSLLGAISHQNIPAFYHSADVFVLPSVVTSGMTEALGVVLVEAMASGCPVIGSNVGGIPDIISDGENGFLVRERDPVALTEKIVALLSDPVLAERFRKAGYATVMMRFSWDRISSQFSGVYDQVLPY